MQSHLNTHDYESASQELRRTRVFRKYTQFLSIPKEAIKRFLKIIWVTIGAPSRLVGRKSLVWTSKPNKEGWRGQIHGRGDSPPIQSNMMGNSKSGSDKKEAGMIELSPA